jgi:hypothetical protein
VEALVTRSEGYAVEIHHRVPQVLLRAYDQMAGADLDGRGIQAYLDFEAEALRYGVDPEIAREDLEALIGASTVALPQAEHRQIHEADFARWGRKGGLETLQRYGRTWFAFLALRRWGKVSSAELARVRA